MTLPVVYFDLETTGLSRYHAGVIQIGATCMNYTFSAYMLPQVPIEPDATKVNGLTTYNGLLYKGNQPLVTVYQWQAYRKFLDYLNSFSNRVILVAHNGQNLDVPLLVRDMGREGLLPELRQVVAGTVDTLPLFRARLPHWGPNNFGLASMAASLGVPNHGAHDAVRDAEILQGVCEKLVSYNDLWSNAYQLP